MGETIVDEDTAREGKYLGLVLQTAERRGEDHSVIVALEIAARMSPRIMKLLEAEALVGYELFPLHGKIGFKRKTLSRVT